MELQKSISLHKNQSNVIGHVSIGNNYANERIILWFMATLIMGVGNRGAEFC